MNKMANRALKGQPTFDENGNPITYPDDDVEQSATKVNLDEVEKKIIQQ